MFHPSIFYTRLIRRTGRGGAGAYPSGRERRGTPWTGRQSIAGPHRDKKPHTHSLQRTILETPANLTCIVGWWEEAGGPGEDPRIRHTERPQPGVEPGTPSL